MPQKFKRRLIRILPYFRLLFFLSAAGYLLFKLYFFASPFIRFARENNITPSFLWDIGRDRYTFVNQYKDRMNIAFLGIPGGEHEGSDLTDTIIFLSIGFEGSDGVMMSIPRDLYLDSLKARINTAYHYGEKKKEGGGMVLSKSAIEEVAGAPVHYIVISDFSGFKEIIDILGGINVYADSAFTDDRFPVSGKENDPCGGDPQYLCRYERVDFPSGWQMMDGEKALKYVRSRYAGNGEGTDFSRSQRQQKVILAIRDKIMKLSLIKDRDKIMSLIDIFRKSVRTDMDWSEKIALGRKLLFARNFTFRRLALDTGDGKTGRKGLLVNPPAYLYDGAWVLVPEAGDFSKIHEYVSCQLYTRDCGIKY